MGGEIGDVGTISLNGEEFDCIDTIKLPNGQAGMVIDMQDVLLSVGDVVYANVDKKLRFNIECNHSATHLMNEALREVGGNHITQQGSYVCADFLRFDFNNFNMLTKDEILNVEKIVNQKINDGIEVSTKVLPIEEAKKLGAQAVFGEKYGKMVRVVDMDYSKEFCCGCHVKNTKDIDKFAIMSIESKGSGIFRIEACTNDKIQDQINANLESTFKDIKLLKERIKSFKEILKENNELAQAPKYYPSYQYILDVKEYANNLKEEAKTLDKKVNNLKKEENKLDINSFNKDFEVINGANVLIKKIENVDVNTVKDLVDALAEQKENSICVFAIVNDGRIIFVCKNKVKALKAGMIVKQLAVATGGNGGGRDDFAQAGGKDVSKLDGAFDELKETIKDACK